MSTTAPASDLFDPTSDPLDRAPEAVRRAWDEAVASLERGELEESRESLCAARDAAEGFAELEDRLECALAAVRIELGEAVSREALRAILMRAGTPIVLHLAAYQIGRLFELEGAAKKALFYARLSLEHGRRTGRPELEARARNLMGNALAADSYFEQARAEYASALSLDAEPQTPWRAMLEENMGYCDVVLGELERGLTGLYRSLRRLVRLGAERFQITARIDLAYGLLRADRPDLATRHLQRAIEFAERHEDGRALRNALFLEAEAAHRLGNTFAARRATQRLGELTGSPDLAEYLLHADVLELVNLRA
ncbi:MAG: hypothetical protein DWQ36_04725 [Acidobacteria bacterium]|nr:MAG: hypothetical protein DWQ30_20585 [Acidobacteriota bacterium]REK10100.1 MAG: hypothetical protein DWQ36_04725 [Acidobacteriota bacterium]